MARNQLLVPVRFTARLFGRGVFCGLFTLALTIAILSFLTSCECDEPFCGLVPIRKSPDFSTLGETPKAGTSSVPYPTSGSSYPDPGSPADFPIAPPPTLPFVPDVNNTKDK